MEEFIPTTKSELKEYLIELYKTYRIRRDTYEEVKLESVSLPLLEFTELSEEELTEKAKRLLDGPHKRDVLQRIEALEKQKVDLEVKIAEANRNFDDAQHKLSVSINKQKEELQKEAVKKGVSRSDIVINKLKKIDKEYNDELQSLLDAREKKLIIYSSALTSIKDSLANVEGYFADTHNAEIISKTEELKDKQEASKKDVFKFNNNLEEKLGKYENYVKQMEASIKIRFMELQTIPLTKEELVDLGYYRLAISATYAYYGTFDSAVDAYNDLLNDSDLVLYLDDFYNITVERLRQNALQEVDPIE